MTRNISINKKYIPLDKSWIIRMGVLDIINDKNDIQKFLNKQKNLSDDLIALKRASLDWNSNKPINIGESGTLYRLLKFASWKLNLNKKFIIEGTLKKRKINDNSSVVNISQKELLKLDKETSQWASAAVLLGDRERIKKPPFKLALTYEAIDHWNKQKSKGLPWIARHDETILNQVLTYLKILKGQKTDFVPKQAEDFCFAYVFGYINANEGEKRWPALRGHESDRILEIEKSLKAAMEGKEINSKDHRVVQAIAMWSKVNKKEIKFNHPKSVDKSWPQFWDFLNHYK